MNAEIIKSQILKVLPTSIGSAIDIAVGSMWNNLEEIRIYSTL